MCIFTLILIIVSIISSSYAIKVFNNNDPKEVVIDEVAGYFVSVLFLPFDYNLIIIAFILFRLFDIYKPFLKTSYSSGVCKQQEVNLYLSWIALSNL